jgi:hypothetical protein
MRVVVDEPGGNDAPLGVDRALGRRTGVFADPDDLAVLDRDIRRKCRLAEPSTTRPFLMSRSYPMILSPHCPAPDEPGAVAAGRSHRGQ